jgi:tetratricopeptide (TPR) repeat protein
VAFFKERYGIEAVKRWYGGAELSELTSGKDLHALEADFRSALASVKIGEKALLAAKARFDRPAIFGRSCPHAVDELEQAAGARLSENDPEAARSKYEELLRLDPQNPRARMALGLCAVRQARFDEARRRYQELARDPALPRLTQAGAEEALGDLELIRGDGALATKKYDQVAELALDADRLRTLDVKRLATGELERDAILNLLIGGVRFGPSWDVAGVKLGEWADRDRQRGVAAYLVGKNFYLRGRWEESARYLDRALTAREPLPPSVRQEALRVRITVACALGEAASARQRYQEWRALPDLPASRSDGMSRFLRRCSAR